MVITIFMVATKECREMQAAAWDAAKAG